MHRLGKQKLLSLLDQKQLFVSVLKYFAKFTGSTLYWKFFVNKVVGCKGFPMNFTKSLKIVNLKNTYKQLLLGFEIVFKYFV